MKKPSIHRLAKSAKDAFIRFPLVVLCALTGSLAGMYWVQVSEVSPDVLPMVNLMLTAALGIPLFFSIRMLLEGEDRFKSWSVAFYIAAVLLLIGIYYSLPDQDATRNTFQPYIRYTIYNVCLHLFVSFSPFLFTRREGPFWSYNITLLIRILAALLYSLVLFVGIVLALLALHLLFDVDIDSKIYPQLFILIMGLFNTWIFLAGIPSKERLIKEDAPPKELKVFAQYVLLPLLAVYLLILYGYGAKIVSNWDWPRGVVSYLIICVAVLGISAFLFLYPYGQLKENQWIKKFNQAFYYLLVPLLALLFLAIVMRLADYGFTVNRYLIFLLGIWLLITCLYFILGKGKIVFIPISLCFVFLLASFGPWGAFEVSERSQINRLREILTQANMLNADKLQNEVFWNANRFPELESRENSANALPLSDSLYLEVSSIVHYLDDYHGFDAVASWFEQDMDQILSAVNQDKLKWQRMEETELYMKTMGLPYPPIPGDPSGRYYSFQVESPQLATPVGGFDYIVDFNINEFDQKLFTVGGSNYRLGFNKTAEGLLLEADGDSLHIPLEPFVNRLIENHGEDQFKGSYAMVQPEIINREGLDLLLKFEIRQINFQSTSEGKMRLQFISGFLLIKEK
jgi:hypothetical protein